MKNEIYSLYLNEVRENLAAPGKQLLPSPKSAYCWCSTIGTPHRYIPVGDLDRSPLMRSYGYASAGDRPTLFAIFPLTSFPSCNMRANGPIAVRCWQINSTCKLVFLNYAFCINCYPKQVFSRLNDQPSLFGQCTGICAQYDHRRR